MPYAKKKKSTTKKKSTSGRKCACGKPMSQCKKCKK